MENKEPALSLSYHMITVGLIRSQTSFCRCNQTMREFAWNQTSVFDSNGPMCESNLNLHQPCSQNSISQTRDQITKSTINTEIRVLYISMHQLANIQTCRLYYNEAPLQPQCGLLVQRSSHILHTRSITLDKTQTAFQKHFIYIKKKKKKDRTLNSQLN